MFGYNYDVDSMDWEEFIKACVEEDKQEMEQLVENEPSPEELAEMDRNAEELIADIEGE